MGCSHADLPPSNVEAHAPLLTPASFDTTLRARSSEMRPGHVLEGIPDTRKRVLGKGSRQGGICARPRMGRAYAALPGRGMLHDHPDDNTKDVMTGKGSAHQSAPPRHQGPPYHASTPAPRGTCCSAAA
ncbi:hypothetical protein S40285_10278 [Stachybotrys chlorohalonatus IBT 40285]|uniref:Uncharacterized protein n=1 Tax=Stachybotrys chlorohalonatus (strain IBT 40285) TaxID=1283841 RepID=A0A084Q9R9_STAC4|nr:hypothetical protein S40285_10278 [Stachybotrys chlorohalonata IBT 40285]